MSLPHALIASWCFVAMGCAQVTNSPTKEAITAAAAVATTPPAEDAVATLEPLSIDPVVALSDDAENSIEAPPVVPEPDFAPPPVAAADIALEEAELAVVAQAAPATQESEPAPSLIPPSAASPTSVETLDFSSLVTRLRKTKAINLRTKVAVKNESDELLEQARAYHTQTGETSLADLRRSYDSLFQELHSLLEDADPPLARDLDRSRTAIWEILADPAKFNASI